MIHDSNNWCPNSRNELCTVSCYTFLMASLTLAISRDGPDPKDFIGTENVQRLRQNRVGRLVGTLHVGFTPWPKLHRPMRPIHVPEQRIIKHSQLFINVHGILQF